jgi:ribosome biogenesis GTPase
MTGKLIKGIAGFYYVYAEGRIYECKARGKFRIKGQTPMVGDMVEVSEDTLSTASDPSMLAGTVDSILPRLNEYDRPPIANVEVCIIVAAAKDPEPLTYVIDRMAVSAELKNSEIVICINKEDLASPEDVAAIYEGIYPVFCVSAKTGEGLSELKEAIKRKQAALAGPSGVGKSSLTNALLGKNAEVGEISKKTLRGKNTTRHSELFIAEDVFLFDTPGFTSFETPELDETQLALYFPEFEKYLGKCRFDNCMHLNEPECAVKDAVREGKIQKSRYESYRTMFKDLKDRKKY